MSTNETSNSINDLLLSITIATKKIADKFQSKDRLIFNQAVIVTGLRHFYDKLLDDLLIFSGNINKQRSQIDSVILMLKAIETTFKELTQDTAWERMPLHTKPNPVITKYHNGIFNNTNQ